MATHITVSDFEAVRLSHITNVFLDNSRKFVHFYVPDGKRISAQLEKDTTIENVMEALELAHNSSEAGYVSFAKMLLTAEANHD